jgi:hypothetical protein
MLHLSGYPSSCWVSMIIYLSFSFISNHNSIFLKTFEIFPVFFVRFSRLEFSRGFDDYLKMMRIVDAIQWEQMQ